MIKVTAPQERRPEIVHLAEVFRARIIDLAPDSLTIEITGGEDKIDGLVDVLRPYGVVEMARTGRLAMTRVAARSVARRTGRSRRRLARSAGVIFGLTIVGSRGSRGSGVHRVQVQWVPRVQRLRDSSLPEP